MKHTTVYCFLIFFAAPMAGIAPARGEIYIVTPSVSEVRIYADDADGDAQPLRSIGGPSTMITTPVAVAVDLQNNELFVTELDIAGVLVFPLDADGDTAPIRTIQGPNAVFNTPVGMVVDPVNEELFVVERQFASVKVFPRTADGDVAPLREFRQPDSTFPRFGFLDIVRNEFYQSDSFTDRVLVFDRTADNGDVAVRQISGPATGMSMPFGVFLDFESRELYVAQDGDDTITVYDADSSGDVAPLRTISGPSTLLRDPQSIVVTEDGELLVATRQDGILVFTADANGDVAPLRRARFVDGSGLDSTATINGLSGYSAFVDEVFVDGFEASP